MLNELLLAERGIPKDEMAMAMRHADIHTARRVSTLRLWLDTKGHVVNSSPIPENLRLWTLRKHNDNSFPFIQMKSPLLVDAAVKRWKEWKRANPRAKLHESREQLLQLADAGRLRQEDLGKWATNTVMLALRQRLGQLESLRRTSAAVLPAALERFLHTCESATTGNVQGFLQELADQLVEGLKAAATDAWIDCAAAILIEGNGAFYVDADGDWPCSLTDPAIIAPVTAALDKSEESADEIVGVCALTGETTHLLSDTFPSAHLPTIGPTILFSRYSGRPANDRYACFGTDSMPVGDGIARRLAAAATVLTTPERKGVTWRAIPGERPKQSDLLMAFVEGVSDAEVASTLAEDDFSEEAPEPTSPSANMVAEFETRAKRLIDAVRGKVGADFRNTPVRLVILRKLDRANRKIVSASAPTVEAIYQATLTWAEGERNVPRWLTLPVLPKGERKVRSMTPPHIAPLGLIAFSKQFYVRGGDERQETIGITADEALRLFLGGEDRQAIVSRRRAGRFLRLVLLRRSLLLAATAHVQHMPDSWERRKEAVKGLDRYEALRTVSVLGILLDKLGQKESYMKGAAFKLGQLLSVVDIVHAGYCADIRNGNVPPSLLGNQVLVMAQNTPHKALAVLSRRWKPYAGWVCRAAHDQERANELIASKKLSEKQRGWDIKKAMRCAREVQPLASELAPALVGCNVDDTFRAELLLGYLAGLPKAPKDGTDDNNDGKSPDLTKEN